MVYFNKRGDLFCLDVSTNYAFVNPGINDSKPNLTNIEGSQVKKPEDIINNIEKLSILREKGVLTEEEYQQKKRELLDRI